MCSIILIGYYGKKTLSDPQSKEPGFLLTKKPRVCTDTCMATKTISVDLEAYECLERARQSPKESFSRVIKRAHWESPPSTAGKLFSQLQQSRPLPDDVLDRLEQAQKEDAPPESPWKP